MTVSAPSPVLLIALPATVVAVITIYVFGSEAHLRYAMALAALVMEPLAAFIFWKGMKPYGEIIARESER